MKVKKRKGVPQVIYANVRIKMQVHPATQHQLTATAQARPTIRQRMGASLVKAACWLAGFEVWTFYGRPPGETPNVDREKIAAYLRHEIHKANYENPN